MEIFTLMFYGLQDYHLKQLETEGIEIIREVAANFENPVMLYSIWKDSSVMLRLAQKAFYPDKIPFPLMHIDTGWKFRQMIEFRERMSREIGFKLIVFTNPEGLAKNINPLITDPRFIESNEDRCTKDGSLQLRIRCSIRRGKKG